MQESATSCRLTAKASTRKDVIVRRKGNNDSRVPQAAAAVDECAHDFFSNYASSWLPARKGQNAWRNRAKKNVTNLTLSPCPPPQLAHKCLKTLTPSVLRMRLRFRFTAAVSTLEPSGQARKEKTEEEKKTCALALVHENCSVCATSGVGVFRSTCSRA